MIYRYALTETIGGAIREYRWFDTPPPVLNEAKGVQWVLSPVPAPVPPTLAELKARKTDEINAGFEQAMFAVKAGYPESEILSWDQQTIEAAAYTADANASTPLLDAMAQARLLTRAELAGRILAKATLFAQVSGGLIGKRQALEDAIAAATADTIGGIAW